MKNEEPSTSDTNLSVKRRSNALLKYYIQLTASSCIRSPYPLTIWFRDGQLRCYDNSLNHNWSNQHFTEFTTHQIHDLWKNWNVKSIF